MKLTNHEPPIYVNFSILIWDPLSWFKIFSWALCCRTCLNSRIWQQLIHFITFHCKLWDAWPNAIYITFREFICSLFQLSVVIIVTDTCNLPYLKSRNRYGWNAARSGKCHLRLCVISTKCIKLTVSTLILSVCPSQSFIFQAMKAISKYFRMWGSQWPFKATLLSLVPPS
jgi:hypothetical protein